MLNLSLVLEFGQSAIWNLEWDGSLPAAARCPEASRIRRLSLITLDALRTRNWGSVPHFPPTLSSERRGKGENLTSIYM